MARKTKPNPIKILQTNRLAVTTKTGKMITTLDFKIKFFTQCSFYNLFILRLHFPSDLKIYLQHFNNIFAYLTFPLEPLLRFHALEIAFICVRDLSKSNCNKTPVETNMFLAPRYQNYVCKLEVIQRTAMRMMEGMKCLAKEEMQGF